MYKAICGLVSLALVFSPAACLLPGNFLCPLPIPDLSQKLHHPVKLKATTKLYFFFFFFFSPEQPSMATLQKHRQQRKRKQTHPLPTGSLSSKLLTSLVSRQMVQNLELSLQVGLPTGPFWDPEIGLGLTGTHTGYLCIP
jgi:hypothetical protein